MALTGIREGDEPFATLAGRATAKMKRIETLTKEKAVNADRAARGNPRAISWDDEPDDSIGHHTVDLMLDAGDRVARRRLWSR